MDTSLGPRKLALDLLERSQGKVKMAAVLSDRSGRIFSWGWNHDARHAEEHALSRANPRRIAGSTVTVAGRRAKSRNLVYARPCEKPGKECLKMLRLRGVARAEYLTKAGTWEAEVFDRAA